MLLRLHLPPFGFCCWSTRPPISASIQLSSCTKSSCLLGHQGPQLTTYHCLTRPVPLNNTLNWDLPPSPLTRLPFDEVSRAATKSYTTGRLVATQRRLAARSPRGIIVEQDSTTKQAWLLFERPYTFIMCHPRRYFTKFSFICKIKSEFSFCCVLK